MQFIGEGEGGTGAGKEEDVLIRDENGILLVYDAALQDMAEVEKELVKIGTYFIRKQEFILDVEIKEPHAAVDRGAVAMDLLEEECRFAYCKIRLIEQYLEAYEHTCDIVEQ